MDSNRLVHPAEAEAASLFEQLQAARSAPEPGTLHPRSVVGTILEDDGGAVPLPMRVAEASSSAGYTQVFDRKTGALSIVNNNMLAQCLRKRHPDTGDLIFSTIPPRDAAGRIITPFVGQHKCLLHPSNPDRKVWDEMGLPICRKANLGSPYQVESHMKNRHRLEWAAIEKRQADEEREEERAFRKAVVAGTVRVPASDLKTSRRREKVGETDDGQGE